MAPYPSARERFQIAPHELRHWVAFLGEGSKELLDAVAVRGEGLKQGILFSP